MNFDTLFFLSSDAHLSKQFWLNSAGELQKSSYPNVKNFTSHSVPCASLKDFHAALVKHAALGHCLIKGLLHRDLDNEPRAGATKSEDHTRWLCLDLDNAPFKSPAEFMRCIPELSDISHIIQYSASSGVSTKPDRTSCHIFVLLDKPIPAGYAKTWLMESNLTVKALREGITLSPAGAALHWPLDVTTCQNDKLLYIAPPALGKGVRSTLKDSERIQLVPGKQQTLSHKLFVPKRTVERLNEEKRTLLNDLRKNDNLKPLRSNTKWVGDVEIQPKPGEATITGHKIERGFVYFNLNGGDSWGYYHPEGNHELIKNFKDEPAYYTRELLPEYFKAQSTAVKEQQLQPTAGGEVILAFRDKRTAQYFNGSWNPSTQHLELHPAKSELQLNHWMQNHGMAPFDVIPVWDVIFDPQSEVILDEEARTINTYVPSKYFRQEIPSTPASLNACPLIKRIMLSAVSGNKEDETFEHWLNWLAVIFQLRTKPMTAWVLHGLEGTGKGLVINKILSPLLGRNYVQSKRASELEEKFTGWLETALIAFVDEVRVSASMRKDIISSDLRNFITEEYITIRNMNRASYQVKSYFGMIFSSNESDPVTIKADDRRYNVGAFQRVKLEISQDEVDFGIERELPAFMNYIMTRKADRTMAAKPVKNEAHNILVENSRTSIDVTVNQIANGDIVALWDMRMDLNMALQLNGGNAGYAHMYHDLIKREIKELIIEFQQNQHHRIQAKKTPTYAVTAHSRVTRDELLVIFEHCVGNMPKTPNKFTSLLKHRNIKTVRMRIRGASQWGLEVEWKAPAQWLQERNEEFVAQDPKRKLKAVK